MYVDTPVHILRHFFPGLLLFFPLKGNINAWAWSILDNNVLSTWTHSTQSQIHREIVYLVCEEELDLSALSSDLKLIQQLWDELKLGLWSSNITEALLVEWEKISAAIQQNKVEN